MRPFPLLIRAFRAALALAAATGSIASSGAQEIRNTATLTFNGDAGATRIASNTVTLNKKLRPTSISFRRMPTDMSINWPMQLCQTAPFLQYTPQPVSAAELVRAEPLKSFQVDNPLIFVLDAEAENQDPTRVETATLEANSGVRKSMIVLTETGVDTGVFAGAAPPSSRGTNDDQPCDITRDNNGWVTLSYHGSEDSMASTASLLIDPEGQVFDVNTGKVIDGAIVTIIDEATGLPAAMVYGDDGISAYPNTVETGSLVKDAGGWVYRLDRGHFRFPLLPPGTYRLKVTPPAGYVLHGTRDFDAVKQLRDSHGHAFKVIAASYGDPFVLFEPEPLTIDIPLEPVVSTNRLDPATLTIEKTASVVDASPGEFIGYSLKIENLGPGRSNALQVTDTLPRGLKYRAGTVRGAPEPSMDPDGRTLRFSLPSMTAKTQRSLSYLVSVGPDTPVGNAVNLAIVDDGLSQSAEAAASVRIRPLLLSDALTVIGRVTGGDCADPLHGRKGVPGVRIVMEDGTFTVTDADGLYHFEGARPGTHVVQIDTATLPAGFSLVTCDRDTRSGGSGISRFVEGQGASLHRVDFQLRYDATAIAQQQAAAPIQDNATAAGNRSDWLARAIPGQIGWLFPQVDHNPRAPALRVVIHHLPGQRVALTLNGKAIEPLSFDGSEEDVAGNGAISRWTGLPLLDRDNLLQARVLDAVGREVATLSRTVHYANVPIAADIAQAASRLVADGVTRPLVGVRITDRDGKPVRAGTLVPFRVEQPYSAALEGDAQQARQLGGLDRREAVGRVTGDDGIALLALQPTAQAGEVQLSITLAEEGRQRTSQVRGWLSAPAREWIVIGFGRGTIGYDLLSKRARATRSKDMVADGQLALYAKGRIKGRWLLTMSYGSDRTFDRERGLLGRIDPDRYYTVYGDGSVQGHDAATSGKLYLRLERPAFTALFGDFETGFADPRLARYSRTLNGAKAEYARKGLHFTVFAARGDERYGRDEIQGNGLSGPYRLSARDIVPNSDKLRIEVRDRLRSDRIVDSRTLTRHIDYDIDSIAGTLRFREPVLSRDLGGNPTFIIVDYEIFGRGRKVAAGARATAEVADGRARLGATLIHDQAARNATVGVVDMKARLTKATELRVEAGLGGPGGFNAGQAASAEIEHHDSSLDVLAYARSQDRDFGTGQQNASDAGSTRIGLDGRGRLSDRLSITGNGWWQQMMLDGTRRIAGEAKLEYRRDRGTLFTGAQIASDVGVDGQTRNSRLLTLGGTQTILNGKVDLDAQAQLPIGGKDESVDFPALQRIGAAWRVTDDVRLIGAYEIAHGDEYTAHGARLGFDISPWSGGKLLSTLNEQQMGENGIRTFAQYGLSQSLPISSRWTIDATLDASQTLSGKIPDGGTIDRFQPRTIGGVLGQNGGDRDFAAMTLGASYRGDRWSWTGRIEYRASNENRRLGLTSSALRMLGQGSTLASSINAYRIVEKSGAVVSHATADLALALRPFDSRWSVLERFQLRHEHADTGASPNNALAVPTFTIGDQFTLRTINNVSLSYRTGAEGGTHGFEASLYHGAKFVRGRYADETVDGFIQMAGIELRKDVGRRIDLSASASVRHSLSDHSFTFAAGPAVGVSPGGNLWISAGYNVSGYRDRDFEQDRYTRRGPYLTMRLRLDRGLFASAANTLRGMR